MLVVLVYQAGIANVFDATGRHEGRDCGVRRVYQGDYRTAENIVRGVLLAGGSAHVCHANVAGDVTLAEWHPGKGGPFEDQQHPPAGCHTPSQSYLPA